MDFKVGDKVAGFDGEKMFEGVVRSIQSYKVKDIGIIKDNKEDQYFNHKYVYPTGTTIKVIPAPKVVEPWEKIKEELNSTRYSSPTVNAIQKLIEDAEVLV